MFRNVNNVSDTSTYFILYTGHVQWLHLRDRYSDVCRLSILDDQYTKNISCSRITNEAAFKIRFSDKTPNYNILKTTALAFYNYKNV